MKNRAIHLFIFLVIACGIAVGQYKEGNRIVTLSKYYLKPWRTVEDGDWKEREKSPIGCLYKNLLSLKKYSLPLFKWQIK